MDILYERKIEISIQVGYMKINSPCYRCLSYAICINEKFVMCDELHYVIYNGNIDDKVATIAIMKCLGLRIYYNTDKVEFVTDRKEIWGALKCRMREYKPKYLRLIVLLGFCYYRVRIWCIRIGIPVIEKVEYVIERLKGRHIWD